MKVNNLEFDNKINVHALLIACCTIFFSPLHAQYHDLFCKSRYTWVAEYTADYELNPLYSDKVTTEMNLAQVVRLENQAGQNGLFRDLELKHYLSDAFLRGLADGAFACYADEQLTQPLSPENAQKRLSRLDTITGLDSEEPVTILNMVRPQEIDLFRIRQVFFFDSRKKQFGARLLAVAPLLNREDTEGKVVERRPLFWIKIPQQNTRQIGKLAKSANYAVQTFMRENAPEPDGMKTLKGRLDLKKWANDAVHHSSHKLLSYDTYDVLSRATLHAQIFVADTVTVFAPDSFAETVVAVQENAIDRVEKIRFVQNWYYDERQHLFAMQVVAVAPLAAVRDSEGELRYYKPLFYSKY